MTIFSRVTDYFIPNTKEPAQVYRARIGKFQGWISIAVNGVLFVIKFALGLMVGSISLIADAVHTLSDVVSSAIVIWGFNEAEKPADIEHPYGHGRAEYIATLIIAIILCVAGIEFIEAGIKRILSPESIHPQWWMIGVLGVTILVKELTARYALFLSGKIASGTLHADAWHHRTDALSSLLVVVAMVAGRFGYAAVDGWAGLGVALFLIYTGWEIAREAINDLIGKPPAAEEVESIRQLVMGVDGVLGAHDIIVHTYGHDKFISVHVEIDSNESPDQAHDISEDVEEKLQSVMDVEPTVHVDPIKPASPLVQEVQTYLKEKWIVDGRISDIHDVRVVETDKHNVILFGVNLEPGIAEAQIVECRNALEKDVRNQFPGFDINIKVSPLFRY